MGHAVNEDRFRLLVDGADIPIAKSYTVNASVFTVPAVFSMVVGHNGLMTELLHNYCEQTPFELYVNDVRVMQGEIDDLAAAGQDETSLKISGRDRLGRLVEGEISSDRSFTDVTFTDLTEAALKEVGLGDVSVVSSNLANRKAITGTYKVHDVVTPSHDVVVTDDAPLPPLPAHPTANQIVERYQLIAARGAGSDASLSKAVEKRTRIVHHSLAIETGSTWWDFLQPQFQRGGLFLWADVFGGFVLGQPNGKQAPLYRILRRSNGKGEAGDVTILGQPEFHRSTRGRYSEFQIHGRKGTGADGRGFASAKTIDEEMVMLLNPLAADRKDGGKRKKSKIYTDNKVKTPEQAAFLALRKMAESRRKAFTYKVTVSGHTVQALSGGGRLVWQPDTTVHVIDEVLGIDEPMYIDDVSYERAPMSTCKISLMRCEDLIFGEEDLLAPPARPKKSAIRMGKTEGVNLVWTKNVNWGGLPVRAWQTESGKILTDGQPGIAYNPTPGGGRRGG